MLKNMDLTQVYDEYAQILFGFVLNLTRNETDTRDILQELFQKLAEKPEILRPVENPKAFLIRSARNTAIDFIRRRTARNQTVDHFSCITPLFQKASDPDVNHFRESLEKAFHELPIEQREVLHLKLWVGMTFQEISQILELSPHTTASRYRYGLDKLKALLRPLYEEIKYEF